MPGGVAELHYDSSPLYTGTHVGLSSTHTITKQGANFRSCDVSVGAAVYNETQLTNGHITAVTEDSITTDVLWNNGDTFSVYITSIKDSLISFINTDLRFGTKVTNKAELNERGQLLEDEDFDEVTKDIFGPGQPIKR
jgi:hypothetical protein